MVTEEATASERERLEALETQMRPLIEERDQIYSAITDREMAGVLGKWFRTETSYSDGRRWWVYARADYRMGRCCYGRAFWTDSYDNFELRGDYPFYPTNDGTEWEGVDATAADLAFTSQLQAASKRFDTPAEPPKDEDPE